MKDAQDLTHEQLVALVNQIREAVSWPPPKGRLEGVEDALWDAGLLDEHPSVGRLAGLAEELDLPEDALDDAVHDLAQEVELDTLNTLEDEDDQEGHISERERVASAINDGGFESQIAFLLEHNSPAEVERLIREAAARLDA